MSTELRTGFAGGIAHGARPVVPEAVGAALGDRRWALRVPVVRPIAVFDRFRRLDASLLDLSLTGCRLLCREPVTTPRRLWSWLPSGLGGRWPHPIPADVVWAESIPGEPTGVCRVALHFRPLLAATPARLQRALAEVLYADVERRGGSRVAYERRVIARGAGHPRVLIGQDLSLGGMRVADAASLEVGAEIQVALHAGGALPPLVVDARVVRRTEAGDAALEFGELDSTRTDLLRKLVHEHPRLIGADGKAAVVSEIVGDRQD